MRKAQKKQIEELIALLATAHQEIIYAIEHENSGLAMDLLAQCQQCAVQAGTMIYALEGEGHKTYARLETYCDTLYQVYDNLEHNCLPGDIGSLLAEKCNELNESVKNDISVRKEVVFCPYKASMWDSLESVWKAAEEDPECDAYVVPIPYYDKNPDGSFGEFHYEGDLYPDYVPVTDYRTYNLAERRPDVVFIHNPYDEYNYVTSVHPEFYASRLKEYTDKLVYIPYYILGETIYDSFCTYSGVVHSDVTIVQSETARQEYIYHFNWYAKKYLSEISISEENIQRKFVALGSPKIDKAINAKKEFYELPEKWKVLLGDKKTVLYNTGVTAILNGNKRELDKIRDVFSCFRNRNDVVLWWRPHPLSTQTVNALRPELVEEYKELIQKYKKEGFGIFDDTSDLYRAIAYTDMYYGDDSSLINLYGVQGKPIVLQNIYTILQSNKEKLEESLCFDDCVYENGTIWFFAKYFNGLFKMEIESGMTEWLGSVPGEHMAVNFLYSKIFKYENMLWLIPSAATELAAYDMEENRFIKYAMPKSDIDVSQQYKYAKQSDNIVYMISEDYKKIAVLDMKLANISVETINFPVAKDKLYKSCKQNIAPEICVLEQKVFWALKDTNQVAMYDVISKEVKVFSVGSQGNQYTDIVFDGCCFWLASYMQTDLVRWNPKNNSVGVIKDYPQDFEYSFGFGKIRYINNYLWLFPARGNKMFCIHPKTLQMREVCAQDEMYDVWFAKEMEDGKILTSYRQSGNKHTLLVLSPEGEEVLHKKAYLPQRVLSDEVDVFATLRMQKSDKMLAYRLYESNEWNLNRILNQLVKESTPLEQQKNCFLQAYSRSDGTSGKAIFDIAMERYKEG